ncbi:AAC(3) family N-acetyltransferase [Bacillus sp. JCM 19041]|uniref:AAC(3) family N-acetyltransferase n=1 Tax=Bacillus sp. JCM 19041 TaxID=1460637 RepID=UPI00336A43FC
MSIVGLLFSHHNCVTFIVTIRSRIYQDYWRRSYNKEWGNSAVPESWIDDVWNEMPPFDPMMTPTFHMGVVTRVISRFSDILTV